MAKWADYLISGIWFTERGNSKYISYVMLHEDLGDSVKTGTKRTKDEVIALIKNYKTVCTIKWNYNSGSWSNGALVGYEKINGVEYLRTHPDPTQTDNLDNLLHMASFGI